MESLANLGIEELPDIEELDEMYDYVVIKPVLSNEDWSLLKESMIYNNDIYNNKDEVKALFGNSSIPFQPATSLTMMAISY